MLHRRVRNQVSRSHSVHTIYPHRRNSSVSQARLVSAAAAFGALTISCSADPGQSTGGGTAASTTTKSATSTTTSTTTADGVICGNDTCAICCGGASCTTNEQDCFGGPAGHGFSMTCDGPEDCPDKQVCCLTVGATAMGGVYCATAVDCMGGWPPEIACHRDSDCGEYKKCRLSAYADEFNGEVQTCQDPK